MIKYSKTYLVICSSLVAIASFQGCKSSEDEKEKKQQEPTVKVFSLEKASISDTLTIPGELIGNQQVDLYAKVNSFVKRLYVDVGSEVSRGQLLALMEAPEMGSQHEGALSRVKSQEAVYLASKATYDRLVKTSQTPGTISQNDLDLADARQKSDMAQLQSAKAALREIQNNQNYLEIRAPFSGVITSRHVSVGAYAGAGASNTPLFTLQEQQKLRLVLNIPESNAGTLNPGQEVSFTIKSLPGKSFTTKVSRYSGALDNRLRAQHIELDVNNNNKELLPGMIPEVKVALGQKDASFVISQSSLLKSTQGTFVIKVSNGKTVWVPVSTGTENMEDVSVYGNISQGDTLIKFASEEVRNGAVLVGKPELWREDRSKSE